MKFNKGQSTDANGTYLLGTVETTYQKLVELFGTPSPGGDGYKTDAEWIIRFEDGKIATIYNYKSGRNYLGDDGTPTEEITDWHVGGIHDNPETHDGNSIVERIEELLV